MRRILNFLSLFRRMKYRSQLLVSFLILAFLVTLLIAVSASIVIKTTVLNQNERSLKYSARQIASNIDVKMWHYEKLSTEFSDRLKTIDIENKEKAYDQVKGYIDAILSNERSSLENIAIYEEGDTLKYDGEIVLKLDNKLKADVSEPLRLSPDNLFWDNTWKDRRGQKVFSLFSRIPSWILNQESLVELRVYETELFSLIHEESRAYNIYVINDQGYIMSATDRDIVGKSVYTLDEFNKSIINSASSKSSIKIGNKEYVMASSPSKHGWTIIVASEMTSMLMEFRNASGNILMACLGVILLAILLTVTLSYRLDKRMALLNKKIQLLRVGEFDQKLSIQGADEFSSLALAIDDTCNDLKNYIQEIKDTGEQKRRAEMTALRSQINTHFLFNALSSIKWLATTYDADDIKNAVEVLSSFLKISLSRDGDLIPVEMEIEHLRAYVYLQKMRYNNEIDVLIDTDSEIMGYKTVRLVLQPMLENAIYHGRKNDGSTLRVSIRAFIKDNRLIFEVEDNGSGMTPERLEKVRNGEAKTNYSGYGLANVAQRIRMCCGDEYGLEIESMSGKGTKITIIQSLFPNT